MAESTATRSDEPIQAATPILAVAPGSGQLTRCGPLVAFALCPFAPLAEAVTGDPAGLAERLTGLATAGGPTPPSFVVLDLTIPAAYRFGSLPLEPAAADSTPGALDGPFPIDPGAGLACLPEGAPGPADGTDLQAGTVPAGGFALVPVPSVPDVAGPVGHQPGDAPPAPPPPDVPALSAPTWNPLADPDDIDLATLGSIRRRTSPAVGALPTQPVGGHSVGGDPTHADDTGDVTIIPVALASAPEGPPARLQLDDGTVIVVAAAARVGRRPDAGLPPGVQPVTVTGEGVEEQHWELLVAGEALAVRNLSAIDGTRLRPPGWQTAAVEADDAPTAILPGTTVHFGHRWAVVGL